MRGVFVSSTGTGCGKTWLARGLARAGVRAGLVVAALKPIETGVEGTLAPDALALARAAGRPELAMFPGFARMRAPLSPRAAELEGEVGLDVGAISSAVRAALIGADLAVVEGAGGLFVPICAGATIADLALTLGFPLVIVAPNALGTLSHTIAAVRSARTLGLSVAAIALLAPDDATDRSARSNEKILLEDLGVPVRHIPRCPDTDDDLADVVDFSGLSSIFRGLTGSHQ